MNSILNLYYVKSRKCILQLHCINCRWEIPMNKTTKIFLTKFVNINLKNSHGN